MVRLGMKGQAVLRFAIVTLLMALPCAAHAQELDAGGRAFAKCLPCHAVGPGARDKVGPVLNGLPGRKAGSVEGFKYSDANKNSGIVWTEQSFLDYIRNPRQKIPGTRMYFDGIKNDGEAAALWAYLRQFNADGTRAPN